MTYGRGLFGCQKDDGFYLMEYDWTLLLNLSGFNTQKKYEAGLKSVVYSWFNKKNLEANKKKKYIWRHGNTKKGFLKVPADYHIILKDNKLFIKRNKEWMEMYCFITDQIKWLAERKKVDNLLRKKWKKIETLERLDEKENRKKKCRPGRCIKHFTFYRKEDYSLNSKFIKCPLCKEKF